MHFKVSINSSSTNKNNKMTKLTTLTQIHKLQERYPFSEEELEILVRCHDHLMDPSNQDDFLTKLAFSSPYSYFFLPGDEMRDRVAWLEEQILPPGFCNELRAAISADPFVSYANEGEDQSLERFLEGIADTGRRGPKEALKVMYDILGGDEDVSAEDILDMTFRLAIASDAMVTSTLDKDACLKKLENIGGTTKPLVDSLKNFCDPAMTKRSFVEWAEKTVPLLSTPFSTFVHHLLFRGSPYPVARTPYSFPQLKDSSGIFPIEDPALLFSLSLVSRHFTGSMQRLYCSEADGRSFNRLEWSLLGYAGPTVLLVRTEKGEIIGAFASATWKDSFNYQGTSECFLFQLHPQFTVQWASGPQDHFMYMNSGQRHSSLTSPQLESLPHGIGFGGSITNKPRLFIPVTLEHCSAEFLDRTYDAGEILPLDNLERFEIDRMEVWGVGAPEVLSTALQKQSEYRFQQNEIINRARRVQDKSDFVKDLTSEFATSTVFKHREETRGRHDFSVDEEHGGYKIERE